MATRLKVFTWSDGFHAFSVATSSRPKALAAWGVAQDLFATGLAHEVTAGADYEAAKASPGEVIERGLTADIGRSGPPAKSRKRPGPTRAQRDRAAALEADLERLDDDHARSLEGIDAEIAQLEERRRTQEATQRDARRALIQKLKAARAKL